MKILEILAELKKNNVVPRLESDQLKIVGATKNLSKDFIDLIRQEKHNLIAFLKQYEDSTGFSPIPAVEAIGVYPTTNAQQRLWVLSQFEGGSNAYNIVTGLYLKGKVDVPNLNRAFQACIRRHESLRTVFKEIEGEIKQVIVDHMPFELVFEQVGETENIYQYLQRELRESAGWEFDLANGPLLKIKLIQLAGEEFAMIFGIHHIISDGWSIGLLVKEVMAFYKGYCTAEDPLLAPLKIHYKDYAHWLSQKLESTKGIAAQKFWRDEFAEDVVPLTLPEDYQRANVRGFDGKLSRFYFSQADHQLIEKFCKDNQLTMFNFLRTSLLILLYKFTGEKDIVIGTPVSGRNHYDIEEQIGLYVNTLPLRSKISVNENVFDFLKRISLHSMRTFEFQDYPFDKIVDDLDIRRDTSRNPLFDVMMVLQDTAMGNGIIQARDQYGFELHKLQHYLATGTNIIDEARASKVDLNFNFDADTGNRFYVEVEYASKLYKPATIERMVQSFFYINRQIINNPEVTIANIQGVTRPDISKILNEFNKPFGSVGGECVVDLLKESFEQNSNRIALVVDQRTFSYAQIDIESTAISDILLPIIEDNNIDFVGLLLNRTEHMLISVLGILKTGAAYVPIDVNYPPARVKYIINDAQLKLILTDHAGLLCIPPDFTGMVINVEQLEAVSDTEKNRERAKRPKIEDTAYLIYTSGSTGNPKGVEITNKNAVSFLKWAATEFSQTPYDLVYAVTSYCFDLSIFELFLPLMQGRIIRLLNSALQISEFLKTDRQVMLNTVPSAVRSLLDQEINWQNVTALNMAGEPVPAKIKKDINYRSIEVRNLYGPTEDTTYSTVYRFIDDEHVSVPIGRPITDTHVYIMDEHRNLVPIGVKGEIFLSGHGIAKGYYQKSEMTAERFMPNPFHPELMMYKTGDIGTFLPDGLIKFIGRTDEQVKIRGYRIELNEIKQVLERHSGIKEVTISKIKGENEQLAVYWVGNDNLSVVELKEFLGEKLPSFMIPAYWIKLVSMPLNSNGKLDKKQLPDPYLIIAEENLVPPATETQARLLLLWQDVLGVKAIGIESNFFDFGGHSLRAIKLRNLILKEFETEFTLNEIFQATTIEEQAKLIAGKSQVKQFLIPEVTEQETYPISFSQERLWVLTNFQEASKAYNMSAAFRVSGNLVLEKLEDAFYSVIGKHESLRTVFVERSGNAVQLILNQDEIDFRVEKLLVDYDLTLQEQTDLLTEKWNVPFDLGKGPLLRCLLLKTPGRSILSFSMHHLISDGWSIQILFRDVLSVYARLVNGLMPDEKKLDMQFKDFAVWQRSLFEQGKMQAHQKFWNETFKDDIPVLDFPTDFHRPEVKTYNGATFTKHISHNLSSQLNSLAKQSGGTLFSVLIALVNVLLKKYANQNHIVIGTPVAGRTNAQLTEQIGFYVNTLAISTHMDGEETLKDFLKRQRNLLLDALEYQDYPFELLVDELNLKRNLSRSPLFDVMVVLQNLEKFSNDSLEISLGDLRMDRLQFSGTLSKYDLTFTFFDSPDGLSIELEYNTDLFLKDTIDKISKHLTAIFQQASLNPNMLIKDISLLTTEEMSEIVKNTDHIDVLYDKSLTILTLFEKAVSDFPDKTALQIGETKLTYLELDQRSNNLAVRLINDFGVFPEDLILLYFDRTEWMIISIIAVLKAGAAYVPVDPTYPIARIDFIIADSGSKLVLFNVEPSEEITNHWDTLNWVDVRTTTPNKDNAPAVNIKPSNLAYVIYTSGTTGNPKGVLIEHQQVTRLFFNEAKLFDFGAGDRWVLFHSYCFDVSVWEMYGALLNGGTLVMVAKETTQDSVAFYDFLNKEDITILNQTPTAFRSLVQNNKQRFATVPLKKVRYLNFAGEALLPNILTEWNQAVPQCKNINLYGITETTVHVTFKELSTADIRNNTSNIGLPLPTLSCYVLDLDLQIVPAGVKGEIYVGGAGVARGYLNKPDLTCARFLDNPFRPGEKMYRSGDFARLLPSGEIEYLGRKDDQVKIRGHRIEISEIEIALIKMDGIKDAVVIPVLHARDGYELVAYYISDGGSNADLRTRLLAFLPAYMIPSYFIELPKFPVNKNGKLDKAALPAPADADQRTTHYVPGRNDIDRMILEIWKNVLQKDDIGIRDNFFDLGGHSLKATRVISKINETYGVKIDLKHLFIDPTVEHLSNYVETMQWMDIERVDVKDEDELIF